MKKYHVLASNDGHPVVRHIVARTAVEASGSVMDAFPGCRLIVVCRDSNRFQSRCSAELMKGKNNGR